MADRVIADPRPDAAGRPASSGRTGRCPSCARSASASPPSGRSTASRSPPACTSRPRPRTSCARCVPGGAEVALCAANPLSTQDDVAAALVGATAPRSRAVRGEDADAYAATSPRCVAASRRSRSTTAPTSSRAPRRRPTCSRRCSARSRRRRPGCVRLRAMEAEGGSPARSSPSTRRATERAFNDRYGTGQSTLDGILRATNLLLAGRTFVVLGYGWTGRGVALRARGAGA